MTLGEIALYLYLSENSFSIANIAKLENDLLNILKDLCFSVETNEVKELVFTKSRSSEVVLDDSLLTSELKTAPYLLFVKEKQGWVGESFDCFKQFIRAFKFKDYLPRMIFVTSGDDIVRKYYVDKGESLCL